MHHWPLRYRAGLLLVLIVAAAMGGQYLTYGQTPPEPAPTDHPAHPTDPATAQKLQAIYGDTLPAPYQPRAHTHDHAPPERPGPPYYFIRRQGNDSNCDFITFSNGVANTGGDGEHAFWFSRAFIPQDARDFKEGYYTLLGPDGSDQPFSIDNLGAAPEAFVGAYEAYGYNAVSMASTPGTTDVDFVRAIYDRLRVDPAGVFAHIWITPRQYTDEALYTRTITVTETGETVRLPNNYHEFNIMAAPDRADYVLVLDGLVGYPYAQSLEDLAVRMRGFNRAIVVSRNDGDVTDHQRFQMAQMGQPYVDHPLGGMYLRLARLLWGPAYRTWGGLIALPLAAPDADGNKVIAFSAYVQYERMVDSHDVQLAALGWRMHYDLQQAGILAPAASHTGHSLPAEMQPWIAEQFGSVAQFQAVFGQPIRAAFWVSPDQMKQTILNGAAHPVVDAGRADGYIVVLTGRAMVAWHPETNAFLVPLGQIYYERLKAAVLAAR